MPVHNLQQHPEMLQPSAESHYLPLPPGVDVHHYSSLAPPGSGMSMPGMLPRMGLPLSQSRGTGMQIPLYPPGSRPTIPLALNGPPPPATYRGFPG